MMTRKEREAAIDIINCLAWHDIRPSDEEIEKVIKALKAEPNYNEWCTGCKEYNHEKHCCPRFNKVIRDTVEEMKAESCDNKPTLEDFIKYAKDEFGINITVSESDNPDTFEKIFGIQPCENAVDREAALNAMANLPHEYKTKEQRARTGGIAACQVIIRDLPPVTPARKKGKWIKVDQNTYHCNSCGRRVHKDTMEDMQIDYPYCHCGAKMEVTE